jgi:hypothetical protein
MNSPGYFERLAVCVERIARHSHYPGIEQAIDQCLEEIDELTHSGCITAEQRGVLRFLGRGVTSTASKNAASAA